MTNPRRGEIWLVQLDPTRGQEIQKTRPAVVISSEMFSSIPMFVSCLGQVSAAVLQELLAGLIICVDYAPESDN